MMQTVLQPLVKGVLRRAARHTRSKTHAMYNTRPLVSFTFDDVPDSAFINGAAILERHGVRGTFYVASGTCGSTDEHWRVVGEDQVRALHAAGHEIGCHTFSHVRVEDLNAQQMEEECGQNLRRLRELCPGIALTDFCYPFGRASLPRKLQLQRRFDSCRGIYQGINAGIADLGMLRGIDLYDRTLTKDKLRRVVDETQKRNGWLIFITHDVAETPSWIGCSPRWFDEVIATVAAEGLQCLPIRDALTAIGYVRPEQ
jgi:peptidoglycan/xylan/chitin deacetylase (PgdA/CDA1 family)